MHSYVIVGESIAIGPFDSKNAARIYKENHLLDDGKIIAIIKPTKEEI